jgi:hypothetical protein
MRLHLQPIDLDEIQAVASHPDRGSMQRDFAGLRGLRQSFAEISPISKATQREMGEHFTPSVIEPSFGISRIMYCLFEHAFYARESDGHRTVFKFNPLVAPVKAGVFPLLSNARLDHEARRISRALTAFGVANRLDSTALSIGKRYARSRRPSHARNSMCPHSMPGSPPLPANSPHSMQSSTTVQLHGREEIVEHLAPVRVVEFQL